MVSYSLDEDAKKDATTKAFPALSFLNMQLNRRSIELISARISEEMKLWHAIDMNELLFGRLDITISSCLWCS